ncbi:MurR/RpiR family transcriptional regulator [Vagococcus vulneris]|uniref:RpiR family transcriptional regulator n=1 Tax=Vagococcus vulneris TaxID=1977869 RepID=A0A429ZYT0_9ENTE|nr:MurR/RpiR family transcriptional regulator [Vagococcus vulneris]RST99112.1 hypothetical protein CBF37_05450 [Vagococcus vulneris]
MLVNNFQKNQQKLNSQEHEIIRFLRTNIQLIREKTLKDVAGELYVSPNTIVRLAKKLEFKGYSELKLAILMEDEKKPTVIDEDKLSLIDQITKTSDALRNDQMSEIINTIKESSHVYFFACGPSKYPCEEMKEKLRICGIEASLYYEPHVMRQRAKQLKSTDTLIVVSLSGETATPLEATKIAKMTEATIISLTGFSQNSIAKIADHSLYVFYERIQVNEMDVSSRIGVYYVLNTIFERLINLC